MRYQLRLRLRQAYAAFRLTPGSDQAEYVRLKIREAIADGIWQGRAGTATISQATDKELEGTTSHPDYEHWTCGTAHIRAQRVLRIVEAAAPHGLTVELVRALDDLVDDAGIASCREALAEPLCAVPF